MAGLAGTNEINAGTHFSNWSCPLLWLLFLRLPASPLLHYSHPYRHKYKGISWQMTNLLLTTTTPSVQPVIHLLQFLIYFVYFRAQALRGTSSAALMKSATAPFYRWLFWQLYNQVRSTRLERFVQLRTIISSVALRICDSKTKTEHLLHQLHCRHTFCAMINRQCGLNNAIRWRILGSESNGLSIRPVV